MGASLIIGIDGDEHRLAMSKRMGADITLDYRDVDVVAEVKRLTGGPAEQILDESHTWGADCIFLGAKGTRGIDRLLLGSVSSAVSARAHCSVEVVRPQK